MHHDQFSDYDIEKLIMMQKLEPGAAGLKPAKLGFGRGNGYFFTSSSLIICFYTLMLQGAT